MELLARLEQAFGDRYEFEGELGRGGMAVVYRVRDRQHGRALAIKVLRPELSASLGSERFVREIQIAAALQHPSIVPLFDSGERQGILYYVMPFVEGETLRSRLRRDKQLPVRDAIQIVREVAEGLSYAHAQGLVHRDIKPENILLSEGHALVADFGVARAITQAAGTELTESGIAIGTPAYMSPEQATGRGDLDQRSDIYALGCVLYEMLAGEPPFTGATAQSIIARHVSERPPSLRVVRPSVPEEVEEAIAVALAKVPADRFVTAAELMQALPEPTSISRAVVMPARRRRRNRAAKVALGAVAAIALAAVTWSVAFVKPPSAEASRVVVYPLLAGNEALVAQGTGEDLATIIGYALDGAGALRAIDGWTLLDDLQRDDIRRLTARQARRLALDQRAAYYLNGRVVPRGDTTDVMLSLYDARADSVIVRATAAGAGETPWRTALAALSALVPVLIPPDEAIDLSAIRDGHPTAVAHFLEAERQYRRAHFAEALDRYEQAIAADSALVIAALKGAQAASWNREVPRAERLSAAALKRGGLRPRYLHFAKGLHSYYQGWGDSAALHLKAALQAHADWRDAWMALGEVYTHLLPREAPLDSLAEAAFSRAHRLDPDFAPPLFHLLEAALRRGDDAEASRMRDRFLATRPDSVLATTANVMFTCVVQGPDRVGWREIAARQPAAVLDASVSLAVGLRRQICAERGFTELLAADTTRDAAGRRWGALMGLQGLLVAQGRYEAARRMIDSATVAGVAAGRDLYVLDLWAGAPFETQAGARAAVRQRPLADTATPTLWFLGLWLAHQGRTDSLQDISTVLRERRTGGDRVDGLVAQSVAGFERLALGDTSGALSILLALQPNARRQLQWLPWEALPVERLVLARLLLARGDYEGAIRTAAGFDSPTPVIYFPFVPASLSIRHDAARALGDARLAADLRARLDRIREPTIAGRRP